VARVTILEVVIDPTKVSYVLLTCCGRSSSFSSG
jgi:hypothetical protein